MIKTGIIFGALLFITPASWAEGLPVEPGMWEMTSVINMPMMPEPRVTTVNECMEKSEISMDDLGGKEMDSKCQFSPPEIEGNTMKWSVDCPTEGGTSRGEWEATSSGDSVVGKGKIVVSFQGQTMEMDMGWEGKRIGDCE